MLSVGCFNIVDEKNVRKYRKVVGSRWVHTNKGDVNGNCLDRSGYKMIYSSLVCKLSFDKIIAAIA